MKELHNMKFVRLEVHSTGSNVSMIFNVSKVETLDMVQKILERDRDGDAGRKM